jgi:hypothetical protein
VIVAVMPIGGHLTRHPLGALTRRGTPWPGGRCHQGRGSLPGREPAVQATHGILQPTIEREFAKLPLVDRSVDNLIELWITTVWRGCAPLPVSSRQH